MAGSAQESGQARGDWTAPVDMQRRSVRVTGWRSGFVEFDFTLGDPLLTVELIMPPAALAAFCAAQRATVDLPDTLAERLAGFFPSSGSALPGPDRRADPA